MKERRRDRHLVSKLIGKTGRSLVRRRPTTPLRHAIAEEGETERASLFEEEEEEEEE